MSADLLSLSQSKTEFLLIGLPKMLSKVSDAALLMPSNVNYSICRWFQSYLLGRTQYVRHGLLQSSIVRLTRGVPQGPVLGPLLFILYTADLMSLIEDNGVSPHLYADDTQVYGSCRPVEIDAFSAKLSECIGVVSKLLDAV